MILRDEGPRLPACLASVQGLVDRVVVVDTGSQDDTVAVARSLGATVLHWPWKADFSAARNHGLAAMGPGWMLVLDADERLAPGAGAALQQAIAAGGFDAGQLPIHNASRLGAPPASVLSGACRLGEPTHIARLFRLQPDLRWEGAVHERLRSRTGRRLLTRSIDAPILHEGYADPALLRGDKLARNLGILRAMAEVSGPDPLPWIYRCRAALRAGEPAEAEVASEGAWMRLLAWTAAGKAPPTGCFTLAALRADLQLRRGEADAALATVQAAQAWGSHPNLDLMRARAQVVRAAGCAGLARQSCLSDAAEAAGRARLAHGLPQTDELSAGATSWAAAELLGLSQLMAGHPRPRAACEPRWPSCPRTGPAWPGRPRPRPGSASRSCCWRRILGPPWPPPSRCWACPGPMPGRWPRRPAGRWAAPDDAALFKTQARARSRAGWLSPHRRSLP